MNLAVNLAVVKVICEWRERRNLFGRDSKHRTIYLDGLILKIVKYSRRGRERNKLAMKNKSKLVGKAVLNKCSI